MAKGPREGRISGTPENFREPIYRAAGEPAQLRGPTDFALSRVSLGPFVSFALTRSQSTRRVPGAVLGSGALPPCPSDVPTCF